MHVTVTEGQRKTLSLHQFDVSNEQLRGFLSTYEVGEKEGEALIPAMFAPCPPTCRNVTKGTGVDCGGNAMHRLRGNVTAMTALGVDIDGATWAEIATVEKRLEGMGLLFFWWQTHSHTNEKPKFRILLPFATPCALKHESHWSDVAWPALMKHLGLEGLADKACKDPCRVYYLPRKPTLENTHAADWHDGAPLDWRPILGNVLEKLPAVAEIDFSTVGDLEEPDRPVNLEELRAKISNVSSPWHAPMWKRVLAGKAPTSPHDQRKAGEPSRYEAWRGLTSQLSLLAEDWMSSDALFEILRPAWSAEVNESPSDHTEWEQIEVLLVTARASAPGKRAQKIAKDEAQKLTQARMLGTRSLKTSAKPIVDPTDEESAPAALGTAEDPEIDTSAFFAEIDEWAQNTVWLPKKEGETGRKIRQCSDNVDIFLRYRPEFKNTLRLNVFTREIEIWGGPLLGEKEIPGRVFRDSDPTDLGNHMARMSELRQPSHVIFQQMVLTAERNSYDPLTEYLEGVKWDGTDRLSSFFSTYFGAQSIDATGKDITSYLTLIGRKWAISAVARALQPGCKVDTMVSLEGLVQGRGKSKALKILGGKFFTDAQVNFQGDKDSLALLTRAWIIEFPELDNMRRSEVTAQRSFLSRQFDEYRPSYGRVHIKVDRRCVFVGTTNEENYLQDEAGNRRHWPVHTLLVDLEKLEADRDQIWAQAVVAFKAGERWYLDSVEQEEANRQTAQRMADEPMIDVIEEWFLSKTPDNRPVQITMAKACEILDEPTARGNVNRIGKALKRLGFTRVRLSGDGRPSGYKTPAAIMNAPRREGPSIGVRVAQAHMQIVHSSP